ncbi:MAG: hypothetical protein HZB32_01380 [Nitrospirae bacterium]|nr:hypothetical protein [Nitrospirota bacterium]
MKSIRSLLPIILLIAIGLLPGLWATRADAASSGNVTVTVTIQNVSVSLSGTAWTIGVIAAGSVSQMTEADDITVTNDGNVAESFTLRLTNPSGWTAGSTTGSGVYVMQGMFVGAANAPVGTDFGSDDVITTGAQTASSTVFGYAGASANGSSVAPLTSVDLWLRFSAPTSTSVTAQQSIVVTVGATVP